MQNKIRILKEETINQIRAGEVIENPFSVVKELVENSLDAGAHNIHVKIEGGGLLSITVQDDGWGMSRDDLLLSIEQHATSKIIKFEDLITLKTLGFRGEALNAIAAVSRMEIITSLKGRIGSRLLVQGGRVLKCENIACNGGCFIQVSSLFQNVPARKKFQKSPGACSQEIIKGMVKIALSFPQVAFFLEVEGKEVIKTSCDKTLRLLEVLGKEFVEASYPIQYKKGAYTISGVIGSPLTTKTTRQSQYLTLNSRVVQPRIIEQAIRLAYGTRIADDRHPIYALDIGVPPEEVDVNVHPQKLYVKFQKEEMIFNLISEAVKSVFLTPSKVQEESAFIFKEKAKPYAPLMTLPIVEKKEEVVFEKGKKEIYVIWHQGSFAIIKRNADVFDKEEDQMLLLDLASMEESVLTDELQKSLSGEKPLGSQALLFPEKYEASQEEREKICEIEERLNQLGIGIRYFGGTTFLIESLASFYTMEDVFTLLENLSFQRDPDKMIQKVLAFRKKSSYSLEEIKHLFNHLLTLQEIEWSPSGKRNFVILDKKRLEEVMKR